jgi:lipid A ethanolaminephosphotransferase
MPDMPYMRKLASLFLPFRIPETTLTIEKLTLCLTLWFAAAYNLPFIIDIWNSLGQKSITLLLLYAVMICCLLLLNLLLLNVLSIKKVFKPSVIFLFLISTILLYSNFTGKQYNPFAFDFSEWLAGTGRFLSVNFAVALIFLFVIPSVLLWRTNISWGTTKRRLLVIIGSIAIASIMLFSFHQVTQYRVQPLYEATRASLTNAIPIHFIDSSVKFIKYQYFNPIHPFSILDTAPIIPAQERHKTVVLVLSESIRADIFTQYLGSITTVNQTQNSAITSCDTYGGSSLQCIFSFLSAEDFSESKATHQQNVLDLLSLSGVNITWLTNQKSCGVLCAKANVIEKSLHCTVDDCDDQALTGRLLAETLRTLNPAQSNLIVIQTKNIASPLYSRFYPKEYSKYLPECDTILVASCSDTQLTNSYNNAMLYVSVMLGRAINQLEGFKQLHDNVETALLFTSKYGESLGEHGYYFHGSPRAIAPSEQILVPLLILDQSLPQNCLSALHKGLSHDVISHTLLGQFHVKTKAYKANQDVQAICTNLLKDRLIISNTHSRRVSIL